MMKRLFLLLLFCLSLWGCAAHEAPPETTPTVSAQEAEAPASPPLSLYDPDSTIEAETAGAVKAYPLTHLEPTGVLVLSDALILTGESEGYTLLQSLAGEDLTITKTMTLDAALSPEDGYIQTFSDRLTYYDPMTLQTVVLSPTLQELRRIHVPRDLTGTPLLSEDGATLYYCTRDAIRALELESGISRVLKEISSQYQSAVALQREDSLLQCSLWDKDGNEKTIVISTENGRLVHECDGSMALSTFDNHYYGHFYSGETEILVFGQTDDQAQTLLPAEGGSFCHFLPRSHGALSLSVSDSRLKLDYYDLHTGRRTAALTLPGDALPTAIADGGKGILWILGYDIARDCPTLYRWDTALLPTGDDVLYTCGYFTRENPDTEGLEECRQYALSLGEAYGVEILVYTDALSFQPADCRLEYEHLPAVLMRQLKTLEAQLSQIPPAVLSTLREQFSGVRISLVREILPKEDALLPESPNGIQFWDGATACIALSAGQSSSTFYHELFHLMDTVIYTKSSAFDRWEDLNPMRFSYTYSYQQPIPEGYEEYLLPDCRAFPDSYSMISPKEERARIMEYAMLPGNAELFRSLTMQNKLTAICKGIREAFGLRSSPESFLWEQYLDTPLAKTP